jgi:TrmH family RNA methyltransferase
MITKKQIKYIHSLEQKKNRKKEGVFVAEGPKVVNDLLKVLQPEIIFATPDWHVQWPMIGQVVEVDDDELRKISFLQHPQQVLAVFRLPSPPAIMIDERLYLALDSVQDPGNLGTIIRIADWFGIDTIFCSTDTADAYNPKVVQATMGSIARVQIVYTDLEQFFDSLPAGFPVYGTLLDGENIYRKELSPHGIIVMGNEGNGISEAIQKRITRRLFIPDFHQGETADSLNVAIAAAITCSEFRRR